MISQMVSNKSCWGSGLSNILHNLEFLRLKNWRKQDILKQIKSAYNPLSFFLSY